MFGHLLVKRMPVMYKINITKIPEYLAQKVDIRSSKTVNAPNDPQTDLEHLTVISTSLPLRTYL